MLTIPHRLVFQSVRGILTLLQSQEFASMLKIAQVGILQIILQSFVSRIVLQLKVLTQIIVLNIVSKNALTIPMPTTLLIDVSKFVRHLLPTLVIFKNV